MHTLGKIGDRRAWGWIPRELLRDPHDEVARTAWRVAVVLAPDDAQAREQLIGELVAQLGCGGHEVHLSLSQALVDLGDDIEPGLEKACAHPDPGVAAHARATRLLLRDPEAGWDAALHEARRVVALGPGRAAAGSASASTGAPVADR